MANNICPSCKKKESAAKKKKDYAKGGDEMKQEFAEGIISDKIGKVMDEFKKGSLRSGSKRGPKVKRKVQAIAIGISEGKRAVKRKKRKK